MHEDRFLVFICIHSRHGACGIRSAEKPRQKPKEQMCLCTSKHQKLTIMNRNSGSY